ncbi:MAG: hypothetical protein ABIT37_14715 [Luteolibacter sp.]
MLHGARIWPRSPANRLGADYIVIGGFAIILSGYARSTMDFDLVVATDPENEAKVYKSLESLPDKAVLELEPGEIAKYTVVRVGDEICVDLMASASGINYEEASKDQADLQFLRENYAEEIFGNGDQA